MFRSSQNSEMIGNIDGGGGGIGPPPPQDRYRWWGEPPNEGHDDVVMSILFFLALLTAFAALPLGFFSSDLLWEAFPDASEWTIRGIILAMGGMMFTPLILILRQENKGL